MAFTGVLGTVMDEKGRAIPAIIRQTLVQTIAYTRQREAFGRVLIEPPTRQSVPANPGLNTQVPCANSNTT